MTLQNGEDTCRFKMKLSYAITLQISRLKVGNQREGGREGEGGEGGREREREREGKGGKGREREGKGGKGREGGTDGGGGGGTERSRVTS